MMKKRIFAMIILAAVLISGCTPAGQPDVSTPAAATSAAPETPAVTSEPPQETDGPQCGGSVTRAITSEPTTLDPHGAAASGQNVIFPYLFDTLIYRDIDNNYHPYLAEKWTISADGKTIAFTLRKGVTFHDGAPLTAEAVRFTYERARAEGSKSPLVSGFANVDKIEAQSEDQVVFHLSRSSSTLFGTLSMTYAGIISPAAVEEYGDEFGLHPVGSGAFRFDGWAPGDSITLVRNENYEWGPDILENSGAPYLEQLVFKVIPDASTQLTAFQTGEVDILFINQPSQIEVLEQDAEAHMVETTLNSLIYLGFNVKAAPFDDERVRTALAHAVDKKELVDLALGGIGSPAFSPLAPTLPGFDPTLQSSTPAYDLSAAERSLSEAGYVRQDDGAWKNGGSGETLSLEILTSTRSPNETLAVVLQDQLRRIGIPVTIKALESASASELSTKGEYQAILWRYDWNDADVLNIYLATERIGRTNRTFYSNPELDEILAAAASELDDRRRFTLYSRAQAILIEEQPWIPLYIPKDFMVMRHNLAGVIFGPMGRTILNEAWLKP